YFPLMRFGDFWGVAKDRQTGEVMSFAKFEKLSDQREWLNSMRKHFDVDGGRKQKTDSITRQIDPSFAAKVTEAANEVDPKLADEIWQMYLDRLPEMSVRKAFMHRKGRAGFSTNAIRSFGHQMFHGAHQLAKLEYMHIMEGQVDTIYQEARAIEKEAAESGNTDDPDANWATPLADEIQRRFEWARNPATSALSSKLTSLGFVWYLGAVPAAAAVNGTQTPLVAFPVLLAEFNAFGAAKELARAGAQWAGARGSLADKLRGDERRAFDEAERIATFSKTMAADMAQLSDGVQDYTSKSRKVAEMAAWMFQGVESGNRQATFLAAFRLAQTRGDSFEDSVALAHKLTYDSHFGYDNANRPRVMQGDIPKVAFLFRQYSMNMTYRLSRDFRDGILRNPSLSVKERNKAAQRFAGILGMTYVFAGTTGLPLIWLVSMALDAMFGDEDEPFDTEAAVRTHLAEQYGGTAATAIMKGPVDALTGVTLSSRVSLNNLWVREAPENLEGQDLAAYYFGEALGPVAKMLVVDPLVAAKEFSEGHTDRALQRLAPNQGKNVIKAFKYITEGVTTRRGDVVVGKDELSKKDTFFQLMGFPAQKVTQQYEENRAKMDAQTKIAKRHTNLLNLLFLSAENDDQKGVEETLAKIEKFNLANPTKAISIKGLVRSGKSRASYSRRSLGGVTLDKDLDYLHDQYNFRGNRKDEE
ncbi:MAG TPA: PLxRFG domain-containing protein, partial [Phycisphaerae bacterium]|nr:PLxRFG domain-containing protein [Phycisphaerae bacterium]